MTLKPRTTTIPIYDGDDLAHMAELRMAADTAQRIADEELKRVEKESKGAPLRGGDPDPLVEARAVHEAATKPTRDAYDAFLDDAAGRATEVRLQAIGRKRFRDLMAAYPPRKVTKVDDEGAETQVDHEDDAPYSVNVETFAPALLAFTDGDVRTLAAPEFGSQNERVSFIDDDLSEGDFERIWMSAYWLNRSLGADPSQSRYSAAHRNIGETSN